MANNYEFYEKCYRKLYKQVKLLSNLLAALLRLHVSTEVTFVCLIVAVRTLFLFAWLLVRYLLAGFCMRAHVVRPYALLSTVCTGKELVAVLTWLLFFGCGVCGFCSFPNGNFLVGSCLVAQVVFLTCFFRLVDGRH